jgi:hypothetical protein
MCEMKMMTRFSKAKKQAGLTLLEALGVIGLAAVAMGGGLALYATGDSQQNSQLLTTGIISMQNSTKQLYSGTGGYGVGSLNDILIKGGKVPSSMPTSGSTISHAMNGVITITGDTTEFTITATNIPTSACMNLVSGVRSFKKIKIGSNSEQSTLPMTPSQASNDCGVAANQDIVFTSF